MTDMAVALSTVFVALAFVAVAVWFYVSGQHSRSGRAFERFVGRVLIAAAALAALALWSWVVAAVVVAFCLVAELILAIRHLASTIERSRTS